MLWNSDLVARDVDLKAAQFAAQRRAKYLLVILYSRDNWRCSNFARFLESSTTLQRILAEQFHVWAADVDTELGAEQMTNFGAESLPFCAVGVKQKFVLSVQGNFDAERLEKELEAAMELGGPEMAREVAFQAERSERESLRAQQERAVAEAERIDRMRMEERAAARAAKEREEEAARQAEREAAAAAERARLEAERAAAEEAARLEALEQRRAQALSAVPEEPPESCPADEVGTLKIVSADGSSVMRRFHASTPVAGLFAVAECLPAFNGGEYQLVTGFPPKPLDRDVLGSTPLREVKGLWPRAVVQVRPVVPA